MAVPLRPPLLPQHYCINEKKKIKKATELTREYMRENHARPSHLGSRNREIAASTLT